MDGSARVAVARQWTVDGLRTKWSALAHNATLAVPIHALTVAGMSFAAAVLTLRAARLFVRSASSPGRIVFSATPSPSPPSTRHNPYAWCGHFTLDPIRPAHLASLTGGMIQTPNHSLHWVATTSMALLTS